MNDYQRTEWVFDFGDCKGCSHLQDDPGSTLDTPWDSCGVLDNWQRHSDRCPRREQFDEAFAAQLNALQPSEVIEDNWERFAALCVQVVDGSFSGDTAEAINSLYAEVAREEAERRMV